MCINFVTSLLLSIILEVLSLTFEVDHLLLQIITSGVAGGDRGVLQRVVALISRPLAKWADLRIPSYAEWVGCKV